MFIGTNLVLGTTMRPRIFARNETLSKKHPARDDASGVILSIAHVERYLSVAPSARPSFILLDCAVDGSLEACWFGGAAATRIQC